MFFKQKDKIIIFSGVLIVLLFVVGFFIKDSFQIPEQQTISRSDLDILVDRLSFGETSLLLEIVDTPQKRQQGLSGRESIPENTGMFFVFDKTDKHGIWMKDMRFPIDIIWLAPSEVEGLSSTDGGGKDSTLQVIDIKQNADPESYPTVFYPRQPARYALEVNAGFAVEHKIKIGDTVSFLR